MSEIRPLLVGIAIIIFGGMFISALISPFVNVDDIEENWIDDYFITDTLNVSFNILKSPITIIADIVEGIKRLFDPINYDAIYITISGTGLHDSDTLDGIYYYTGYNENEGFLGFERNDTKDRLAITVIEDDLNQTFIFQEAFIIYYNNLFSRPIIYEGVGVGEDVVNSWNKTNLDYDFNPTATGLINVNENELGDLRTFNNKIEPVLQETQDKIINNIRAFGIIPEVIGLPIMLLILIGFIFTIIKIIRG